MAELVLVTGGLGYIGSHTVIALHEAGYETVIYDNLSNSSERVIPRLERLIGATIKYVQGDVRDSKNLEQTIKNFKPHTVIHFAALKSISESIEQPEEYYSNNVDGTKNLIEVMNENGVKKLIFSSSATVYGAVSEPAREDMPLGETNNPYGASKSVCEKILKEYVETHPDWSVTSLRYFNPTGAHESGLIGEDPKETPNNLMPYIAQVATGRLEQLTIHGADYPTPDGTGVRDYIHVMDLAEGHVAALKNMHEGLEVYNLGSGRGYSVRELIDAFKKASNREINFRIGERRAGDLPSVTADPSKSKMQLHWVARRTLEDMCRDTWNWQHNNPDGY